MLETRVRAGKIERRRQCDRCRHAQSTVEVPKHVYTEMRKAFLAAPKCKELVLTAGSSVRIVSVPAR